MHRTKAAAALYETEPIVFQFMAAFARFEFALKDTKHFTGKNYAQPDWGKFEKEIAPEFERLLGEPGEPAESVRALLQAPPKRQKISASNALLWDDDPTDETTAAGRAGDAVRRVRNNLFHGGKDLRGRTDRDVTLIRHGMAVLELMLEASPELAASFSGL